MANSRSSGRLLFGVVALVALVVIVAAVGGVRTKPEHPPAATATEASPTAPAVPTEPAPAAEAGGPSTRRDLAVCKSARAKIPDEYRQALGQKLGQVESYRGTWQRICEGAGDHRLSLAPYLDQLTAMISAAVLRFSGDVPMEIHPSTWVPGFTVNYNVIGGQVDTGAFMAAAELLGLPEDQSFWKVRSQFESGPWGGPWEELRKETDFETCMRLTEIDWSQEYGRLTEASRAAGGGAYRAWASREAKKLAMLLGWFSRYKAICACRSGKPPEQVLDGIAKAADGDGVEGPLVAQEAKAAAEAVRAKRVTVEYEWDKPDVRCSVSAMPCQTPEEQPRAAPK